MKYIAVICNNQLEWKHFVDVSQWNFSKQNMRYKCTRNKFVNISKQITYIYVNINNLDNVRGTALHSIVYMCTITPEQEQFLNSYVRGE
jgi:hypothetical protein